MNERPERDPFTTVNPYPSKSQANWHRLYDIAPQLRRFYIDTWANLPPPKPTDRDAFVALAACMCDPDRREILRALLFDLLADDIVELLAATQEGK